MARMTGFVWQDEYLERLAKLSDQEVGRLVRALSEYHATGNEPELTGRESVAFDFIKVDIDRIEAKYTAKCETNSDNRKRSLTTDDDRQRPSTTVDKDKDKVIDKVIDKDKDIDKPKRALTRSQRPTAEDDRAFEKFWLVYPRHEGKQAARKAFDRLKVDDAMLGVMVNAITRQRGSDQWSDPRYIPYPATWLNGRRWEDEPVQASGNGAGKRVSAQQYEQRDYDEEELEKRLGVDL